MSIERPWEDFADPVAASAQPPPQSAEGVDWEDVGKGAFGRFGRGVTGLVGTGGTLGELYRAGFRKAGVPEDVLEAGAGAAKYLPGPFGLLAGPSGKDIQEKVEEHTGKFYEPKSLLGQYVGTAAEFLPGAFLGGGGLTSRAVGTLLPATVSETAGQLTKGTEAEPWARGIAGLTSGIVGGRLVTPAPPPTAARQAAVNVLDRAGVPTTAGDRTGSNAVQWAEAVAEDMPFSSGAMQARRQDTLGSLNRALTERTYNPARLTAPSSTLPALEAGEALPSARVARKGRETLGDEFNRLSTYDLRSDPQLQRDLYAAQANYVDRALPSQRATGARDIEAIRDDIVNKLLAGGGRMRGDIYQGIRSDLGEHIRSSLKSDPKLSNTFRDYRGALDRAMERGLPPGEAAAWRLNNQRYANMKQLEPAVAAGDEYISPAKIAQAVRSGRISQASRGLGDLDELARAAKLVIKPKPSSGTAQRTAYQNLFNAPNLLTAAAGGAIGSMFGPLVGIGAAAAPHLVYRAIASRPGQRYLANQVAPQTTRGLIAQAIAQQASSQPGGIERNIEEREAYARKRQQNLRARGL